MEWSLALIAAASAARAAPRPAELTRMQEWVAQAFLGREESLPEGSGLFVERQEWGTFRLNRSVAEMPLRIGRREFGRGIGTHATGRIRVRLPAPGKTFEAVIGVDNCRFTGGGRGSVVFAVEAREQELFRSELMRGSDPAGEMRVDLGGAAELTLVVEDGGDGPHSDVADWAEAKATLTDGTVVWLDELPVLQGAVTLSPDVPFSFTLDGEPSTELLPRWERTVEQEAGANVTTGRITYRDAQSGLAVTCTVKSYDDFPAADWVLEFENTGDADSGLLEHVLPLDLQAIVPPGEYTHLRHSRGSSCEITDFLPVDEALEVGQRVDLAPSGGRSSNGVLPFLNVDWSVGGAIIAVGWSGQWAAGIARSERAVSLTAGQQTTRVRLRPGERIRTPRIVCLLWGGEDRQRAHNLFRQLMLTHYCPRADGELILPPIAYPTAATILASGQPANEQNQLGMLAAAADLGIEVFWLDAYWFPKGFPGGVGTWIPRPEDFPSGLRPLSDAAHERGMEFLLWFEPERVARHSLIAKEHPEFCLDVGGPNLLLNLGMPEAREYMIDLLSRAIDEHGIDIYREDFNIDPLPFWQAADQPEREGLTEIRFVEGLYAMWDELVGRHPGLPIDNCASGGRRIDLETISRSYALWRSDFQDVGILSRPDYLGVAAIASQVQTVGLGLYVPFSTSALWSFDPYSFRSTMCCGVPAYLDLRDESLNRDQARAAIAELKELRPYFLGDLYPLMAISTSSSDWCAYQFDRPDLGEGMALFFRRHESPYLSVEARLEALDPKATYQYTVSSDYKTPKPKRASGAELAVMPIEIGEAPGCALLRYRELK